jgi:hypothetical protein
MLVGNISFSVYQFFLEEMHLFFAQHDFKFLVILKTNFESLAIFQNDFEYIVNTTLTGWFLF